MGEDVGSRCGFTLLETLAALTIVGIALVVLTGAFGEGLRAQAQVGRHVEAVALAEARMSELAALPSDSLPRSALERRGAFQPPFERYQWHARLERDARRPRLVRATVTVRWGRGEYVLASELYRRELAPELGAWRSARR